MPSNQDFVFLGGGSDGVCTFSPNLMYWRLKCIVYQCNPGAGEGGEGEGIIHDAVTNLELFERRLLMIVSFYSYIAHLRFSLPQVSVICRILPCVE